MRHRMCFKNAVGLCALLIGSVTLMAGINKSIDPLHPLKRQRPIKKAKASVVGEITPEFIKSTGSGFGTGPFTIWKSEIYDYMVDIGIQPDGKVYGIFSGTPGVFDPSTDSVDLSEDIYFDGMQGEQIELSSSGNYFVFGGDGVLAKLNPQLEVMTQSQLIAPDGLFTEVTSLALAGETVFLGGRFRSGGDVLVLPWINKYSSDFTLLGSTTLPSGSTPLMVKIGPDGFLYACGWIMNHDTNLNIWLGKYSQDLTLVKQAEIDSETGYVDMGTSLDFGDNGEVFVAGSAYNIDGGTCPWVGRFDKNFVLISSVTVPGTDIGDSDTWDYIVRAGDYIYVSGYIGQWHSPEMLMLGQFSLDLSPFQSIGLDGNGFGYQEPLGLATDGKGKLFVSALLSFPADQDSDPIVSIPTGWLSMHTIPVPAQVSTPQEKPRPYPNPFQPKLGHTAMAISNLPANSTLKLFTLKGELVREIPTEAGNIMWDVKNTAGESVQSGVYFGVVDGQDSDKTFKVVIQR